MLYTLEFPTAKNSYKEMYTHETYTQKYMYVQHVDKTGHKREANKIHKWKSVEVWGKVTIYAYLGSQYQLL